MSDREHNRSDQVQQTVAARPRARVFLPQSFRERFACALWGLVRMLLFRITPCRLNVLRVFLLRRFGAMVNYSSFVHPTVFIDFPWNLEMGRNVVIEHEVIINCMGRIGIDDGTRISQYSHLCAGTHAYEQREMPIVRSPISVGKNVWIAADAFVGPGVTIGDGALLAARSSAFSNLPAGQICVGEPAKPRRERFEGELPRDAHEQHVWSHS